MTELDALTQVKNIVSKTLKISLEKLDIDADFDSFGIDSIIAMELMSNLSKEMNISITPAQFTEVNTIKELAQEIEQLKNETNTNEAVQATVTEEKVTPVAKEPLKVASVKPQARSMVKRGGSPRKSTGNYQNVLNKILSEFSIDLTHRKFESIEDIADSLITNHLDDLLNHYHIVDEIIDAPWQEYHEATSNEGAVNSPNDIAIVGLSCNFPDAPNAKAYWNNLIGEKNSIREIPVNRWDWNAYYAEKPTSGKTSSKWAALIENHDCFDAGFFQIEAEEAKLMDPQERLLLQEVYRAFQDGGIDPSGLKGSNTAVYTSYEYSEYEHYLRNNIHQLDVKNKPFFSSSSPTYYLSNRLSFLFDFKGPSETFNVNCAGSAVAINRAYHSLSAGETDVAVVGGVSLNLFADDYIALSKYEMLSPNGTCGVFDDQANGFTRGEGAASVILKRLEDAEKDHNKIYGIIKNSSQNNRGKARFMQEIDVASIAEVLSNCYEKAQIDSNTVQYIEVDGYATKWADSFEYEGVKKALGTSANTQKTCALGSLKGNIGNLESVNGLASLIKLALSMENKEFPATISNKKTNVFIDIDNPNHPLYIANTKLPFENIRKEENPIRAGINSFADTGVNVHILVEEYVKKAESAENSSPSTKQLFVLSAKDTNRLLEMVNDYIEFTQKANESTFLNTLFTLQTGREAMAERLVIVASSFEELNRKLLKVKNQQGQKIASLEKEAIFYGTETHAEENPLKNIFSDDMTRVLMQESQEGKSLEKLAKLWIAGFDIPWKLLWENQTVQKVSLPLYPFYKERYWAEIIEGSKLRTIENSGATSFAIEEKPSNTSEDSTIETQWFFYTSEALVEQPWSAEEKMTLFLQQQIATLLKQPATTLDMHTNFLDLGLNSIDIGTFVSNTMNLLKITLSPAVIFTNKEISSLASYLSKTYAEKVALLVVTKDEHEARSKNKELDAISTSSETVVPLQTNGKELPIFAVSPGGNGTTLAFQYLVEVLGTEQPFYGVEFAIENYSDAEQITIENIAKNNIQALQQIQPKGPYRLLGLSNGGMIAFEMARQLLEKEEKVEIVGFLDCFSPSQQVIDMVDEIVGVFKGKFTTDSESVLNIDANELRKLPENERFDYLYNAIVEYGFTIPKDQFEITYQTAMIMDKSCRAYQPQKLNKKIKTLLFRATEGYMEGYDKLPKDYEWNKLLASKIEICDIEANHFSITNRESSSEIAKKIVSLLKKSNAK